MRPSRRDLHHHVGGDEREAVGVQAPAVAWSGSGGAAAPAISRAYFRLSIRLRAHEAQQRERAAVQRRGRPADVRRDGRGSASVAWGSIGARMIGGAASRIGARTLRRSTIWLHGHHASSSSTTTRASGPARACCSSPRAGAWSARPPTARARSPRRASCEPDLVLLDVQLPDLDGFEVVDAGCASNGAGPAVILVSSRDSERLRLAGRPTAARAASSRRPSSPARRWRRSCEAASARC